MWNSIPSRQGETNSSSNGGYPGTGWGMESRVPPHPTAVCGYPLKLTKLENVRLAQLHSNVHPTFPNLFYEGGVFPPNVMHAGPPFGSVLVVLWAPRFPLASLGAPLGETCGLGLRLSAQHPKPLPALHCPLQRLAGPSLGSQGPKGSLRFGLPGGHLFRAGIKTDRHTHTQQDSFWTAGHKQAAVVAEC